MTKKSIIFLILPLALFFALPFFIGVAIKYHYEQNLEHLSHATKINLKLLTYERGWFTSKCVIAANYPLADKSLDDASLNNHVLLLHQTIYHGPFVFDHQPTSSALEMALALIDSSLDETHHFARTLLSFDTSVRTHLHLNHYSRKDEEIYSVDGLSGDVYISADKKKFTAQISLNQLISTLNNYRKIEGFKTNQEINYHSSGIWQGTKVYQFKNLSLDPHQLFDLKEVTIMMTTIPDDKHVNVTVVGKVKQALVNHVDYGPQQITLFLKNLDGASFAAVQKATSFLQSSTKNEIDPLHALLNKNMQLQIASLHLNTAFGTAAINGYLHYPFTYDKHDKITGKLPVSLAEKLVSDYYAIHDNVPESQALKLAKESLLKWTELHWLTIQGNDYYLNFYTK